jgi:hypothetical protein
VSTLKQWIALTSLPCLAGTPFLLLFNKTDLFAEKLKVSPLHDVFSDYEKFKSELLEDSEYECGLKYFEKTFRGM